MESKDIHAAMDQLAQEVQQAIVKYLNAVDHAVIPNIDVKYADKSTFAGESYWPSVSVRGEIRVEA